MKRTVLILLPTGSKVEAQEARRALGGLVNTASLRMGTVSMHSPGQALSGDVIVIGAGASTVEQDAIGQVYRVKDMADLPKLARKLAGEKDDPEPEPAPKKPPEPEQPAPDSNGAGKAADAEEGNPDHLAGMTRVEMIQYAASHWPGQRRWATLSDDNLVAAIRSMEAAD